MSDPQARDLNRLGLEDFRERLGEKFRLPESIELELVEARSLGEAYVPGSRAPFALLFAAQPQPLLAQGTYRLDHEELGRLELFLVPTGQDENGEMRYEAIFT